MNYLIISDFDYPMQDGTSYFRKNCKDIQKFAQCYWLNFFQNNQDQSTENFIVVNDLYTEIQSAAKNYEEQIRYAIREIQPDLIHSSGAINITVKKIAEELGIPCLLEDNNYETDLLNKVGNVDITQQKKSQDVLLDQNSSFLDIALELSKQSPNLNIGIFCTWGDQGLGNLAHTYTKLLRKLGYKVHIFSFQSYLTRNQSLKAQRCLDDWEDPRNADSVYYSYNIREEVGLNEFLQYVRCNNLRTVLFPEVCCPENWARLYKLKKLGYNVITIPLIEIVRDIEVLNHNDFDLTLCCTQHSFDTLKSYGINNLNYIGHGFESSLSREYVDKKIADLNSRQTIKYLHVAGHNPLQRKNTKKVIEAFIQASKERSDIELTITSLIPSKLFVEMELPPCISIIDRPLPREEVEDLYKSHDVSIQVSSHEGLGLGFFESLQKNTPVITLNGSPHNEFIEQNHNGLLLDCWKIKISDNIHAIINAWDFKTSDLSREIISLNKDRITVFIENIYTSYNERLSEEVLLKNLNSALKKHKTPEEFSFPIEVTIEPINTILDESHTASHFSVKKAIRSFIRLPFRMIKKILSPISKLIS